MSKAWRRGSTRAHREMREFVLARDGYRCRAHADGWCDKAAAAGRKGAHVCLGVAPLTGARPGHAHHTHGHAATGNDPNHMVASCAPCNLYIGDPTEDTDPQPIPRTRW